MFALQRWGLQFRPHGPPEKDRKDQTRGSLVALPPASLAWSASSISKQTVVRGTWREILVKRLSIPTKIRTSHGWVEIWLFGLEMQLTGSALVVLCVLMDLPKNVIGYFLWVCQHYIIVVCGGGIISPASPPPHGLLEVTGSRERVIFFQRHRH